MPQYLGRIAVQYDLAQLAAIVLNPAVISLFIWRDGFFSLQVIAPPAAFPHTFQLRPDSFP